MSLTGSSQEIPLADLIQVGANNRQTCRISVRADRGDGQLYLERGELVHATCGPLRGEEAAYRLLGASRAAYRVEAGAVADQRTIHRGCQHVVLEAARRADEEGVAIAAPEDPPRSPRARSWWRWAMLAAVAVGLISGGAIASVALQAPTLAPGSDLPAAVAVRGPVEAAALVDPGDSPPVAIATPSPRSPAAAALVPTIVCRILVGEDGAVEDAKIYRSRLDLAAWEDAALDAVATWRFEPARQGGAPIAAWLNVGVGFVAADAAVTTIRVKGSDTIGGEHGVGQELARAFEAAHPGVEVTWEGLGSSTAFAGLLDGTAEVGASSRPVDHRELADAARLGVRLEEHVLGYDGVAVIVHPDAAPHALTVEQVGAIFRGDVTSWAELGGDDAPIRTIGRPTYSGTHAFFKDKVLGGAEFVRSTEVFESSEQIVAAVAQDPTAVAYVGLSWLQDGVRALAIDGVAPEVSSVRDGRYPIYRPLLLYTRGAPSREVSALVRFARSAEAHVLLSERGFVPAEVAAEPELAPPGEVSAPPRLARRVRFHEGSASLGAEDRRALWRLGMELAADPRPVLVLGHADADGNAAVNAAIARRRADVVAAYLVRAGADPTLVTADAGGADAPVATNASAAGRRENRRADVLIAD